MVPLPQPSWEDVLASFEASITHAEAVITPIPAFVPEPPPAEDDSSGRGSLRRRPVDSMAVDGGSDAVQSLQAHLDEVRSVDFSSGSLHLPPLPEELRDRAQAVQRRQDEVSGR